MVNLRMAPLLLAAGLSMNCYQFAASRAVAVDHLSIQSECPDFSGLYDLTKFQEQCSTLGKYEFKTYRVPMIKDKNQGGFAFMTPGTWLRIDQDDCRSLEFTYPRDNGKEKWEVSYQLDLVRTREAMVVEWTGDSLYWRDRFEPVGVNLGPSVNHMSLSLKKLNSGGLRYRVEASELGRLKDGLECSLPKVESYR